MLAADAAQMRRYRAGRDTAQERLARPKNLSADNPRQQENPTELARALEVELHELHGAIGLAQRGDAAAALVLAHDTQAQCETVRVRRLLRDGQDEEEQLLASHRTAATRTV